MESIRRGAPSTRAPSNISEDSSMESSYYDKENADGEENDIDITDPDERYERWSFILSSSLKSEYPYRAALEREFEKLSWSEDSPGPEIEIETEKKHPPPSPSPSLSPSPSPSPSLAATPSAPTVAAQGQDVVIPNKVLLAEIQLLRKEMRMMQEAHSREIAALRSLLLEAIKSKSH